MNKSTEMIAAALALIGVINGPTGAGATEKDIIDTAVAAGQFKTFAAALYAVNLVSTLRRRRAIYGFCTHGRGICQAAAGCDPKSAEAGKQGSAHCHPHLSPCARPRDGGRRCQPPNRRDVEWPLFRHKTGGWRGNGERCQGDSHGYPSRKWGHPRN